MYAYLKTLPSLRNTLIHLIYQIFKLKDTSTIQVNVFHIFANHDLFLLLIFKIYFKSKTFL